jgi:hypothetical protein
MTKIALAMTVAAFAVGGMGAGEAGAAPPGSNECATANRASDVDHGILLLEVGSLTEAGYRAPAAIDEAGNRDGFVCAIPLGDRTTPRGTQLYEFYDNTGPGSTR